MNGAASGFAGSSESFSRSLFLAVANPLLRFCIRQAKKDPMSDMEWVAFLGAQLFSRLFLEEGWKMSKLRKEIKIRWPEER